MTHPEPGEAGATGGEADPPQPDPRAEQQAGLDRRMHYETFGGPSSPKFPMPCWCNLARSHTYSEWLDAGGPDSTGYPEHRIQGVQADS